MCLLVAGKRVIKIKEIIQHGLICKHWIEKVMQDFLV